MRHGLVLSILSSGCVYTVVVEHELVEIEDPFSAVVVEIEAGDLRVHGTTGTPSLDSTLWYHGKKPDLSWRVEGETLFIDGVCPRPSLMCTIDLDLTVPHAVDVTAEVVSGGTEFRDLDGDFDVSLTSGMLALHQLSGDAVARLDDGTVVGTDLALTSLDVETTSGSVDAVFVTRPSSIDVEVTTGSIDLLVPGGRYDVSASTTAGSIAVVGIVDDPAADARIGAHTTIGSVRLVGYDPPSLDYLPDCAADEGDPTSVSSVGLDGELLTATFEYGGGCATHDLTLCWPDQAFMESQPVQARLEFLHDDHDDPCDSVVIDTRTFDLGPLAQAWRDAYQQDTGTMIVHVGDQSLEWSF